MASSKQVERITVTRQVINHGLLREQRRPLRNHYYCNGPDGRRFDNSSLATLRERLRHYYGSVELVKAWEESSRTEVIKRLRKLASDERFMASWDDLTQAAELLEEGEVFAEKVRFEAGCMRSYADEKPGMLGKLAGEMVEPLEQALTDLEEADQ